MRSANITEIRFELWRSSNFLWIMIASVVSLLGDHFTLIAFPWLVLKMTGDPLAMGMMMVVTNVPRLLLILMGGALVDCYSAKKILINSLGLNGLLMGALALAVLSDHLSLWMIFIHKKKEIPLLSSWPCNWLIPNHGIYPKPI